MSISKKRIKVILGILLTAPILLLATQKKNHASEGVYFEKDTIVKIVYDTVYIHDTVVKTQISYVDTTPIVLSQKRSFVYIKDTFNIDDRTFYITEQDDTVKAFYFDYTYYIFKYHFQDSLVAIDSVLGCDLYTHFMCDDRERIVIFHTCEGESRMIINMLNNKQE